MTSSCQTSELLTNKSKQVSACDLTYLDLANPIPQLTLAQFMSMRRKLEGIKKTKQQSDKVSTSKSKTDELTKKSFEVAQEIFKTLEGKMIEGNNNKHCKICIQSHIGFYSKMNEIDWLKAVLWSGKYRDGKIEITFNPYWKYLQDMISHDGLFSDCTITTSKNEDKETKKIMFMTFLNWKTY